MNSKPEGTEEQIKDGLYPARIVKYRDNAWGEGWWHLYMEVAPKREIFVGDLEGVQRGLWRGHPRAFHHPIHDQYSYPIGATRQDAALTMLFDYVQYQHVRSEDTETRRNVAERRRNQEVVLDDLRAERSAKGLEP